MRGLAFLLALAPLFPPLAGLALFFVPWVRRLPLWGQALLALYGASLLLPALFAPEPLAWPLALFRFLYVLGLVGLGVALNRPERALGAWGVGLFLLYLTGFAATYWVLGDGAVRARLSHPFHSPVGFGFLGGLGLLLALHLRYPWPFRALLGLLGGAVLLLSGSRGGMLGFFVGGAAALLFRRRGLLALALGGGLLLAAFALNLPATERFFQAHLSGREGVWLAAYRVFQEHPWTGVGPYLLGERIGGVLFGDCFLFPLLEARGLTCPDWLRPWGGLWTFAHNHLLQALGEGGGFGAVGLLLLAGGFLAGAWGDGLLFGLLAAYLGMGMVDNPFSVPSPFRGEVFFLLGGMALARLEGGRAPLGLGLAGGVALLWSLPFLYLAARPEGPPPALRYLVVPDRGGAGAVALEGGEGYRLQVWLCAERCRRLGWEWPAEKPVRFPLPEALEEGKKRLVLVLFREGGLALRPAFLLEEEVGR